MGNSVFFKRKVTMMLNKQNGWTQGKMEWNDEETEV